MRSGIGLPLIVCLCAALPTFAQQAEFLDAFTWTESADHFGGLSAIEMADDGTALLAVGDRGRLIAAQVDRQGPDQIVRAVTITSDVRLARANGQALPAVESDAEGLAVTGDGRIFISFEAVHGVGLFDLSGRMVSDGLDRHPHFERMQLNSSLEALAVDARGRLYTAPERSGQWERPFPVYRRDATGWSQPFAIPRRDDYLLVGMDFGPDGRLYVLERTLRGILFATRVRSFELSGDVLSDETLVLETENGTHENLEGISVWRDQTGRLRVSMVSDDNLSFFLRTQIVEYRLP